MLGSEPWSSVREQMFLTAEPSLQSPRPRIVVLICVSIMTSKVEHFHMLVGRLYFLRTVTYTQIINTFINWAFLL